MQRLRRLLELVWRLLALVKLCERLDKLDSDAEHFIQLKVIKVLEEKPGNRSPLFELVLDSRRIKISYNIGRRDHALHLSFYLGVNGFVEFVNNSFKLS
jgi:hypothetical protein